MIICLQVVPRSTVRSSSVLAPGFNFKPARYSFRFIAHERLLALALGGAVRSRRLALLFVVAPALGCCFVAALGSKQLNELLVAGLDGKVSGRLPFGVYFLEVALEFYQRLARLHVAMLCRLVERRVAIHVLAIAHGAFSHEFVHDTRLPSRGGPVKCSVPELLQYNK